MSALPDGAAEEPPRKKTKGSFKPLQLLPKRLPDLSELVPLARPPHVPLPDSISRCLKPSDVLWMGIGVTTHEPVPSGGLPDWRPGRFGFETGAEGAVVERLRLVQVGWAVGDCGSQCNVKEHLILPQSFSVSAAATKEHGITTDSAMADGIPLPEALLHMFNDACRVVQLGGRLCSHHLDFDASIIAEEMRRCGLSEEVKVWEQIVPQGFCTMSRDLAQYARKQAGEDIAPKTVMKFHELVHKLLRDVPSTLTKQRSAGFRAHMHWRVLEELVLRRGKEGGTDKQSL